MEISWHFTCGCIVPTDAEERSFWSDNRLVPRVGEEIDFAQGGSRRVIEVYYHPCEGVVYITVQWGMADKSSVKCEGHVK